MFLVLNTLNPIENDTASNEEVANSLSLYQDSEENSLTRILFKAKLRNQLALRKTRYLESSYDSLLPHDLKKLYIIYCSRCLSLYLLGLNENLFL